MDRSQVATLIAIEYTQGSFGQQIPHETRREIFCQIDSVSRDEFFSAGREGYHPQYRVSLFAPDYEDEPVIELNGRRFAVYRTYLARDETLELYVETKAGV